MALTGRPGFRKAVSAASLIAAMQVAGAIFALAQQEAATGVRMEGPFAARLARDISGIACPPSGDADGLRCLVVNDESAFAQTAVLRDGRLSAGPVVPLIGPEPPGPGAAGSASAIGACPGGPDDFGEFDGEGIAWAPAPSGGGGSYFVTGSHACSRNKARLRASTHLLARIDVDASGTHAPAALTWRLGPALAATAQVGPHYNQDLTEASQGLDVEGIAASGDRLFVGLRAPSLDGSGFVVSAAADDLFAADDRPVPTRVAKLALGRYAGIRDMAALPDGRLLLLTGPAQGQEDVPSGIALTRPSEAGEWPVFPLSPAVRPVAGNGKAKAEGLAVLAASGDTARVLVLFEDPANGGAQEHSLRLPPP